MAVQQKAANRQYRITTHLTEARYNNPSIDILVWGALGVEETRQLISDLNHTIQVVERERLEEVKERQQEGVRQAQEKDGQFVVPSPPVSLERPAVSISTAQPYGYRQNDDLRLPNTMQQVRCALPPQTCDVCGVWVDGQDMYVRGVGNGQGSWAGHRDCVRT